MDHLEELHDRWEEARISPSPPTLDSFIQQQCVGISPEVIVKFRQKAIALASISRFLNAAHAGKVDANNEVDLTPRSKGIDLRPGAELVPGYQLEKYLATGGFGEVWQARGPGGFPVAMKFVNLGRKLAKSELRGLEVTKRFRHPHLLTVHGAWKLGDWLITAMELADSSLAERLQQVFIKGQMGLPREEAIKYLGEAAQGLDFLNQPPNQHDDTPTTGMQHRDVKPENLLLLGGSVKLADFGIARIVHSDNTGHTGALSTPFAPPEFFNGQTSHRSDQYSLAVTYCLLRGGQLPFTGTPMEVMRGHLDGVPDLTMLPEEERPAVARALRKSPADRWPSCQEFVAALENPPPQFQIRVAKARVRKTIWTSGSVAGGLLMILSSLAFFIFSNYIATRSITPEKQRNASPKRTEDIKARPIVAQSSESVGEVKTLTPDTRPDNPMPVVVPILAMPVIPELPMAPASKPITEKLDVKKLSNIQVSEMIGPVNYGTRFRDDAPDHALLVGLNLTLGRYGESYRYKAIDSLEPIYLTAHGLVSGKIHGQQRSKPTSLRAKEGYAIGEIRVVAYTRLTHVQVRYMRIIGNRLDPKDAYSSNWVGDGDGKSWKTLGGDGLPIVGITGVWVKEMRALGILQMAAP